MAGAALAVTLLPLVHPALRPLLGTPSHLIWFAHVFPVALVGYTFGWWPMIGGVLLSSALVAVGESFFGAGYGIPADQTTIVALAVAVGCVNLLVGILAAWVRRIDKLRETLDRSVATAMNAAPDAMLLLDSHRRIRLANPKAIDLLDGQSGLVGRLLTTFLPEDRETEPHWGPKGGCWHPVITTGAGRHLATEVSTAPVVSADQPRGWLVTIRDRSEALRQEAQERRAAVLRDLGVAIAGVAHELNNPLTNVQLQAEFLATAPVDTLPDQVREAIATIAHEGRRAGDIARQLLTRVRSSTGSGQLRLHEVITRVLRTRAGQLAAHGVAATTDLGPGVGEVQGRDPEMEQVLVNLIANAEYAVHQHRGGGRILIRTRLAADADHVELRVEDDGPGLSAAVQAHLFEPFFSTKGADGNGLGLSLVRQTLLGWGGELAVDRSELGGAAFVLRLKLAETPSAPVESQPPELQSFSTGNQPLRVLLVDDDLQVQNAVRRALERTGMAVTAVAGVTAALHELRVRPFEVVVSDLHLGTGMGTEIRRHLGTAASIPGFVLLSGDPGHAAVAEYRRLGGITLVPKPFVLSELVEAVYAEARSRPAPP
jgi:signal transduction histidine kinase/ActR/RegA family two-component response regulator